MSTPTKPNDADRELANDLIMTVPTSIKLSVPLWNKAIDEWATHKIAAHRSSAVAEAVAGLEARRMTLEELQKEAASRDCVVVKRGEWEELVNFLCVLIPNIDENDNLELDEFERKYLEAWYEANQPKISLRPEAKGGA